MVVSRLLVGFALTFTLGGCHLYSAPENIERLKADIRLLKTYYRANPPPSVCQNPGTPQSRICKYRLIVKHTHDDYYQGHVDPALVAEGVKACKEYIDEYRKDDPDFNCQEEKDYPNIEYGFKVEGAKPEEGVVQAFENVPGTWNLRLIELRKAN